MQSSVAFGDAASELDVEGSHRLAHEVRLLADAEVQREQPVQERGPVREHAGPELLDARILQPALRVLLGLVDEGPGTAPTNTAAATRSVP